MIFSSKVINDKHNFWPTALFGSERFTFGIYELGQGVEFLPVAMGLFGIAEVLEVAQTSGQAGPLFKVRLRDLLPSQEEWRRSAKPMLRGSVLGFLIGLVPGPSPVIATFTSYLAEKRLSKHPEEFGHGAIEGVAGPEAANNAAVGGAYVPLMALGIPFTPAMAVVLGALMLHNVTPGPNMMNEKPDLFWGVIASMYIGNFMLIVLNLPLVNAFVSILKVPRQVLLPIIVLLCLVGVYSLNASQVDLVVLAVFGLAGFIVRGLGFQPAPLILAMVVGPMIETSLRQSLKMTGGSIEGMILRPICLILYAVVLCALLVPAVLRWAKSRRRKTAK